MATVKIGFDDYRLTHSIEDLENGVDADIIEIDDPIFEESSATYDVWRKKSPAAPGEVTQIRFHKRDDIGNGERFVDQHGNIVKWSIHLGWRYYDGKRWRNNDTREIERRAEATARSIFIEANRSRDNVEASKYSEWAVKSASMARIGAMLESAKNKPGMAIEASAFDQDSWLFNIRNGTIDLRTGTLRKHSMADMITKYSDVEFNPQAKCPIWDRFLARVVPDPDTCRFLQKAVGYSLTGSIDEQCFFLLYGTGKNGKSKFLETIAALLSEYSGVMRPESLMLTKHQNNAGDIADLRGLRFVYSVEPPPSETLNTSFIKQQTGGEELKGKFLYKDLFSFHPTHKLWIGANHDIKIRETDEGMKRRVRQAPFKIVIPEEERDYQLGEKLRSELSGILNWSLVGLSWFLAEGLTTPDEVKEATKKYFDRVNPIKDFQNECCLTGPPFSIKKSALYKKYLEWSRDNGDKYPLSRHRFNEIMLEMGFSTQLLHGYDYWSDIGLKIEE